MFSPVQIGNRLIGSGQPAFIIAEAGVNHNGKIDLAHRLIDEAAKASADAVKFQMFDTAELIVPDAPKAGYQIQTTGEAGSQYSMLKALELSLKQHSELKSHCEASGILYLCTPYDIPSVDALDGINVAAFKIASTDTTNIPFLRYIAEKRRPVLLSTGMSSLGEIEEAVFSLWNHGLSGKLILLHCTSEYPTPMNEINLRAMATLQQAFRCPVGFSDHTAGIDASTYAVVAGAPVVEKHFTLDRTLPGPDHRASIEAHELATLVAAIRGVELALGDGIKRPMPSELKNKTRMQKSIVSRFDIHAGAVIKAEDLTFKRPGSGLSPAWLDRVVGKRAARNIPANTVLGMCSVAWSDEGTG